AEVLLDATHHRLAIDVHRRRAAARKTQARDPARVFLQRLARGRKVGKRRVLRGRFDLRGEPAARIAGSRGQLARRRAEAEAIDRDDGLALHQATRASAAASSLGMSTMTSWLHGILSSSQPGFSAYSFAK